MEERGVVWLGTPNAAFAEEMSYAEANKRIGVGDGQYDLWPEETRVWLVVFKGRWQMTPIDPSQAAPQPLTYEGCALVLFTARDASLMTMGDAVCP